MFRQNVKDEKIVLSFVVTYSLRIFFIFVFSEIDISGLLNSFKTNYVI